MEPAGSQRSAEEERPKPVGRPRTLAERLESVDRELLNATDFSRSDFAAERGYTDDEIELASGERTEEFIELNNFYERVTGVDLRKELVRRNLPDKPTDEEIME